MGLKSGFYLAQAVSAWWEDPFWTEIFTALGASQSFSPCILILIRKKKGRKEGGEEGRKEVRKEGRNPLYDQSFVYNNF